MARMAVKEARRRTCRRRGIGRRVPPPSPAAAQLACVLEASAEKPGNITPEPRLRRHELRGHAAQRDRARARARARRGARRRRHRARRGAGDATRRRQQHEPRASRCCSRRWRAPRSSARGRCATRTEAVLAALTLDDARDAYAAIRAAGAGGLDEPVEHDVRDAPTVDPARRDGRRRRARLGRRRVREGYAVTFDVGLPALRRALEDGLRPRGRRRSRRTWSCSRRCPTRSIARKRGRAEARARVGRGAAALAAGGVRDERGARGRARPSTPSLRGDGNALQPGHDGRPRDRRAVRRAARGPAVILLVSVSARMLAELAVARRTRRRSPSTASGTSTCSGCARACRSCATSAGAAGWRSSSRRPSAIPADGVVYGAGLENRPDLVARLAAGRTLLGCDPRRCGACATRRVLGASLRAAGLAYPRDALGRRAPAPADRARRWLRKPVRGGGGRGVRAWRGGRRHGRRRRPGAHRRRCRARRRRSPTARSAALLGVSEQLIGRRALGARGFTWCGNVVAAAAAGRRAHALVAAAATTICAHLAAAFGLRGLFGVDLVWDGERAVGRRGQPAPDRVARDDRGRARGPPVRRAPRGVRRAPAGGPGARGPGRPAAAAGKAVVYAVRDVRGPGHPRLARPRDPRRPAPRRGDRAGAIRSARSSRQGRRPRPCSPTSRRARAAPAPRPDASRCRSPDAPMRVDVRRLRPALRRHHGRRRPGRRPRAPGAARARSARRGSPTASTPACRSPASTAARRASTRRSTRRRRSSPAPARRSSTGWARPRCEAQRAAVALADAIGATIDPAGPLLDGAAGRAFSGPRREHGDARRHPRPRRGRGRCGGPTRPRPTRGCSSACALPAEGRTLVVVDARAHGDRGAGRRLPRAPRGPRRRGAVDVLRAVIREEPFSGDPPVAGLEDLGARLRG